MKKIIISESQLPLLKQVLAETKEKRESKIVIISERQIPLLEEVLREKRERLDEAILLNEGREDWKNLTYVKGKTYQFQPLGKMPNLSKCTTSSYPNNKNITQYLNQDRKVLYYHQKSQSENSVSEYYLTKLGVPPGKKKIIRKSNHWSYYICPNYKMQNPVTGMISVVTCIFGTQRVIPGVELFYTYVLPDKYKNQIPNQMVVDAYNRKDANGSDYQYKTPNGEQIVILDRLTLGLLDNVSLCGECVIDDDDNYAFKGL